MPPPLIEQLQIGAVDGSSPITDLLRKAKLAAVKLKADDFAAWVDLELAGYENSEKVPDYRIVSGALKFHNPYRGWQPIFGMDHLDRHIRQPIGELFTPSQQKGGTLLVGVPGARWTVCMRACKHGGTRARSTDHLPCHDGVFGVTARSRGGTLSFKPAISSGRTALRLWPSATRTLQARQARIGHDANVACRHAIVPARQHATVAG